MVIDVEDEKRDLVVHAEARGRRVHDVQALVEDLDVRQRIKLLRIGILVRIAVIDAIRTLLGHEDDIGFNLSSAQSSRRVRREVRIARAGAKDDDAALLHVADGLAADVRLCDLAHLDGGMYTRVHIELLECILQGECIHDRSHHAHVVRRCAVHALGRASEPAPDVAATDDDGDIDAALADLLDLLRDVLDDSRIDAEALIAGERFTTELQDNAFIFCWFQNITLHLNVTASFFTIITFKKREHNPLCVLFPFRFYGFCKRLLPAQMVTLNSLLKLKLHFLL